MLAAVPSLVTDVGAVAATLVAVLTCGGLISRIPLVKRLWRRNVTEPRWEHQKQIIEEVCAPRFDAIESELRTNGGASLRDAINRIEHDIGYIQRKQWEAESGTPG